MAILFYDFRLKHFLNSHFKIYQISDLEKLGYPTFTPIEGKKCLGNFMVI